MNPTLATLLNRRSIRKFTDQPIAENEKDLILQATLRAPTAGNQMLYTILEIEDQALKDRLAVTCDNQPFIATAPWVLLFLADYQRWYDAYQSSGAPALAQARGRANRTPGHGDLLLACCDALIAAHTAVVAAEALGIGSCYIGDILEQYETHQALLDLPQYALPIAMVVFGYPTPDQAARPQPSRFDRRFIVHTNRYHRAGPAELDQMFAGWNARMASPALQAEGITQAPQLNYLRKFTADFSVEMTRSAQAMIARWCSPPEEQ